MTAKARILKVRHNQNCDQHDWQEPWPMAVVRNCTQCGAWLIPPWPQGPSRASASVSQFVDTPRARGGRYPLSPTDSQVRG
jgi:hypothetical protein